MALHDVIGLKIHRMLDKNFSGADIASQNYFSNLKVPPTRQSVSVADSNVSYKAYEYLLEQAALNNDDVETWNGFNLRIVDGTKVNLPRTKEILSEFDPPKARTGVNYYPQAWMVTLMGGVCLQPLAMVVGHHLHSERDLFRQMMPKFSSNDLVLLDRGLGGSTVYLEAEKYGISYLHRAKTSGAKTAGYIKNFIEGKKASEVVSVVVADETEDQVILIRLIRGPKDSEGKRIIFVTNLLDETLYSNNSLRQLYQQRWAIETQYGRIKNQLHLENFHSKTVNGIKQEMYANLLTISLAAAIEYEASKQKKLDRCKKVPSFKAAIEVIRRHLGLIIGRNPITTEAQNKMTLQMIEEASRVLWKKQPGRSFIRVSKQPIDKWSRSKTLVVPELMRARKAYENKKLRT